MCSSLYLNSEFLKERAGYYVDFLFLVGFVGFFWFSFIFLFWYNNFYPFVQQNIPVCCADLLKIRENKK